MQSQSSRLQKIIKSFRGRVVAVFGDFMYDELLRGDATRISPEAPVPVVLMGHPHAGQGFPGGAGNVAANIAALGGQPLPFGAIGTDESGRELVALLKERRIGCEGLVQEKGRVTPRKVRIVARQHQLLRMDFEEPGVISQRTAWNLFQKFSRAVARLDALIISDYQKGTVTTELCDRMISVARQKRVPVFVDPKPEHPEICRHATAVTPNLNEAELMLGRRMRQPEEIREGGQRLLAELGCACLVITLGSEGMMLFRQGESPYAIHGVSRPVYDVTGAGDTAMAVLALAGSSGASMEDAAELANLAGGRVVLKFGTAEITARELSDAVASNVRG